MRGLGPHHLSLGQLLAGLPQACIFEPALERTHTGQVLAAIALFELEANQGCPPPAMQKLEVACRPVEEVIRARSWASTAAVVWRESLVPASLEAAPAGPYRAVRELIGACDLGQRMAL